MIPMLARGAAKLAVGSAKVAGAGVKGLYRAGFEISNWDSVFARWFPSLTRHFAVTVQAGKGTTTKTALHLALATVFGLVNTRDAKIVNYGLRIKIDHLKNTVTINFGITSLAMFETMRAFMELLDSKKLQEIWAARNKDGPAAAKLLEKAIGTLDVTAPYIAIFSFLGLGGDIKALLGKGINIVNELIRIISNRIGGAQMWDLGRENIRAGRPTIGLQPIDKQLPFDEMTAQAINIVHPLFLNPVAINPLAIRPGQTLFDRQPASNPQPPSPYSIGKDLRTLVVQVLHDPGIRPPVPQTDSGPPTVDDEMKFKPKK